MVSACHHSDARRQSILYHARARFLVAARCREDLVGGLVLRPRHGQPTALDRRAYPIARTRLGDAQSLGDAALQNHPDGDRLTVEHAITAAKLDGVAEGMAEVERFSNPPLSFIPPDDVRLDRDAANDDPFEGRG